MSQLITYNNLNDGVASRRYTGYPLNSTLVSSYTPDTIRSIINHAAAGQPYTTSVWIRINRVGIQINAQDTQIARTRTPVFIPIALVHDIFMQPSINNVICIVYDELQSNMKGVLLYIVHPTDAQSLRDDFRIVKQANNVQPGPLLPPPIYSTPVETRYSNGGEIFSSESNPSYVPIPNDPHRTSITIRHPSPRRLLYAGENDTYFKREVTSSANAPALLPPLAYTSLKGSYHSGRESNGHRHHRSSRKHKSGHTQDKRSSDSGIKERRKNRSPSPEKQGKSKQSVNTNSQVLTQEQIQQQLLQQQQMAAWQAGQPVPIPMGIYNRYVPKTIPLPTGETLKTTLPPPGSNTGMLNGTTVAYIEPQQLGGGIKSNRSLSHSRSNSPQRHQQRSRPLSAHNARTSGAAPPQAVYHHHRHHHRRHHNNDDTYVSKPDPNLYATVSHSSRTRSKYAPIAANNDIPLASDHEAKQYLKMLVDEMQSMKVEMNRLQQTSGGGGSGSGGGGIAKGRPDSIRTDLKDLRSDIDIIRARMSMTPKIRAAE